MLLIVHLLELGWWYVANRSEEPLVVEPGHPVESGELDIVDSLPGAVLSNNLCFIQADRRLGQCVDAPISQECCSGRRVGRRAGSMVDHDALVDLAVQATLEASDEVALGQELCRKHGISEQTFYRWRSKYGGMQVSEAKKRSVELRATGRRAAPLSGLRGMAPLAVAGKWFLRMNKLRFVPIGRRTSDNEVDVHGKRLSTCTAALPYVAVFVAVSALPLHRPCRSEDTGGGRERPPFGTAWIGSAGWPHVHSPCHARGGSLPCHRSLRDGY